MNIKRKLVAGLMATCLTAGLATGLTACGSDSADGTVNLTFQIWDVAQRDGMQAMCDAYTEQNPNVHIEVQVTSWDEYWTKLEAAAISNQMPDIFWMHTNEILKYADYGKLADCSDIVDTEHFSEISLANASGSDGNLYAVPKDKDTVGLVYNKEMFDAAGVTPFIDMFDYCVQSVNNAARPEWKTPVSDTLLKIYTGELDIDTGLQTMQDIMDEASAEYYPEEDA